MPYHINGFEHWHKNKSNHKNLTNVWFADEATPLNKGDNIRLTATVPTGKDATDKFGVNWNVVAEEPPKQEEG